MDTVLILAIVMIAVTAYEFSARKRRHPRELFAVMICAALGVGILVGFLYFRALWVLLPAGAMLGYAVGMGSRILWARLGWNGPSNRPSHRAHQL